MPARLATFTPRWPATPGGRGAPRSVLRAGARDYGQVMAASTAATTSSATPNQMSTWSILTARLLPLGTRSCRRRRDGKGRSPDKGPRPGNYFGVSSDALEQLDEQVYEAHQQAEDDPKDLHDDAGDLIEGSRPEEHQSQHQYHRYAQQQPHHYSPPTHLGAPTGEKNYLPPRGEGVKRGGAPIRTLARIDL